MRVVFFKAQDLDSLAEQLNMWLENCPDEYVHDIKYTYGSRTPSAMIVLKSGKNRDNND